MTISWDASLPYASFSVLHSDTAVLYRCTEENAKHKTVCVNAGHGTKNGNKVKTYCHPDLSLKYVSGSTDKGAQMAAAVSSGTQFKDGTTEAAANLSLARILKNKLLAAGYDVLMLRDNDDTQLDNVARTVIANRYADCHIALHYDGTAKDIGFFYIGVPNIAAYRAMEPVASHWEDHLRLGEALVAGEQAVGRRIWENGRMDIDLTQTSYATIPSVNVEVGDTISDHSPEAQGQVADGLVIGLDLFFGFRKN